MNLGEVRSECDWAALYEFSIINENIMFGGKREGSTVLLKGVSPSWVELVTEWRACYKARLLFLLSVFHRVLLAFLSSAIN